MRVRGWGWVLPATAVMGFWGLLACSSSEEASADRGGYDGGYWGGQTGSLVPCSTPAFTSEDPSVPSGDAAVVFHTGNCTVPFSVTDQNGESVPFELVQLDDGVVLLKTDTALTPGVYEIETGNGQTAEVTVTEARELPMQAGTLERLGAPTECSRTFALTFDESMLAYLPLLKLEYSLDGGPVLPWFEFGTVPQNASSVALGISALSYGSHELRVYASIAGEAEQPPPAVLTFSHEPCPPGAEPDSGAICAMRPLALTTNAPGAPAGLALLGLMVLGLRRRRAR